jgi:ATP-dependent Clp protease, protease subunit
MDNIYNDTTKSEINIFNEKNEIHFNGPINHLSISKLVEELLKMECKIIKNTKTLKRKINKILEDDENNYNDDLSVKIDYKPIKLFITSNGGYVYQVFSAIDTINNMEIPVHTICKGFVASAGTILSLSGKKRFITKNSYMLIHEIRSGMWGKYQQIKDDYENCKTLMDHLKKIYMEKTNIKDERELDEILKKDISWNAQICLEKGLVDEII